MSAGEGPSKVAILYLMVAAAGLQAKAQEIPDASMEDSLKSALQSFDSTQSTRYIAAFKDINGDGNLEAHDAFSTVPSFENPISNAHPPPAVTVTSTSPVAVGRAEGGCNL